MRFSVMAGASSNVFSPGVMLLTMIRSLTA